MTAREPVLLIYRALGLGDLLTAVPALRGLRRAFPDHRVVLATPERLRSLALHTKAVDEVVPATALEPVDLEDRSVDLGVNLHGRGPQSHAAVLAAAPRRLIAWAHPDVPESGSLPAWRADEHEVERWCRLLRECGIDADPSELEIDAPPIAVPERARNATLIHPGAASPARRWPVERYAAVAASERAARRSVVVTGGTDEVHRARRVARLAGLPRDAVLAGVTSVMGLAALVASAARVVCGDTGVAHLATALGTPSVVLFGPTSPRHWGPPPARRIHRALWAGTTGDPHGSAPDRGLLAIEAADVIAELDVLAREDVLVGATSGGSRERGRT